MQQRRLRLGDILDDYCPRERRITSHAVVAMVEDEVKQTRCTACHADHEFKGAKVPPPRRKRLDAASGESVEGTLRPKPLPDVVESIDDLSQADFAAATSFDPPAETDTAGAASAAAAEGVEDDGPVHRRLIRATLPRPEGQPPAERKAPDFTIRQPGGRGGRGDEFDGNRAGQRFGHGRRSARPQGDAQPRFGGPRQGGEGSGQGRPGGGHPGGPRGNRPGQGSGRGDGRRRGR